MGPTAGRVSDISVGRRGSAKPTLSLAIVAGRGGGNRRVDTSLWTGVSFWRNWRFLGSAAAGRGRAEGLARGCHGRLAKLPWGTENEMLKAVLAGICGGQDGAGRLELAVVRAPLRRRGEPARRGACSGAARRSSRPGPGALRSPSSPPAGPGVGGPGGRGQARIGAGSSCRRLASRMMLCERSRQTARARQVRLSRASARMSHCWRSMPV